MSLAKYIQKLYFYLHGKPTQWKGEDSVWSLDKADPREFAVLRTAPFMQLTWLGRDTVVMESL